MVLGGQSTRSLRGPGPFKSCPGPSLLLLWYLPVFSLRRSRDFCGRQQAQQERAVHQTLDQDLSHIRDQKVPGVIGRPVHLGYVFAGDRDGHGRVFLETSFAKTIPTSLRR